MEEELSQRSYGNLVHYALQIIYEKHLGKLLSVNDLEFSNQQLIEVLNQAIIKLNHQIDFYEKGMNYIHKSIAERVVRTILEVDKKLIAEGNTLEILSVEGNFENIDYYLNDDQTDKVSFYGFIDRIDRLNGKLRIIDYKTAKTKNLLIKEPKKEEEAEKLEQLFFRDDFKQAMQLSIYAYAVLNENKYPDNFVECGIWSFAEANKGVQNLQIYSNEEISRQSLVKPMKWVKNVITEILNPESDFVEEVKQSW